MSSIRVKLPADGFEAKVMERRLEKAGWNVRARSTEIDEASADELVRGGAKALRNAAKGYGDGDQLEYREVFDIKPKLSLKNLTANDHIDKTIASMHAFADAADTASGVKAASRLASNLREVAQEYLGRADKAHVDKFRAELDGFFAKMRGSTITLDAGATWGTFGTGPRYLGTFDVDRADSDLRYIFTHFPRAVGLSPLPAHFEVYSHNDPWGHGLSAKSGIVVAIS